ncbi:MAG: hypothetical protein GF317_03930 [Candidatus Lokiarchaeota archaeon]|nr:hypothetical protein [Candidatus Lokiarchaeota archaeon]
MKEIQNSFKYKIVMCGNATPDSIPFIETSYFSFEDFKTIGCCIKPVECITSKGDSYLFVIWHLNTNRQFRYLIPTFMEGAKGIIILFDKSNPFALEQLEEQVKRFKGFDNHLPMFIVSYISNPRYNSNVIGEFNELTKQNEISNIFDVNNLKGLDYLSKKDFFRYLITKIHPEYDDFSNFSIKFPAEEDDFKLFVDTYKTCPICHKNNHLSNLKKFYYSKEKELLKIREKFLDLNDKKKSLSLTLSERIRLGVVCCSCYKEIFEK